MSRKVIQIAVEPRHHSGGRDFDGGPMETDTAVWLLCDDGTVYFKDYDIGKRSKWVVVGLPDGVNAGVSGERLPEKST